MRRVYAIILFALSFYSIAQQSKKLDSLLKVNSEKLADTARIKYYWHLADAYSDSDSDSSGYYSHLAIVNARSIGHIPLLAKSQLERYYSFKKALLPKQLVDSLLLLHDNKEIIQHKPSLQHICIELGIQYRRLSNFDKSISYLLESLKLSKELKDRKRMYNSCNSLANTYSQIGITKRSVPDLNRALDLYRQAYTYTDTSQKNVLGMILSNQGVTYFNLGQIKTDTLAFKQAIIYYHKSLKYRLIDGDSIALADLYANMGGAYQELYDNHPVIGHLKTANYWYEKALEIDNVISHPGYYAHLSNYGTNLSLLGKAENNRKKILDGIEMQKKSFAMSNEYGDTYTSMMTSLNIGQSYVELKMSDSAVRYYVKHIDLKDTILNAENKQIAEELAAKYESELKDTENKNLREQAGLREEVINKKNGTIRLMIVASLIMLGLIVLVFLSRQKIRRSKKVIEEQKKTTEDQKLLLEEKQKEILDSINYAKRLQDAAIPSHEFFKTIFPESFIFYRPKDIVAGDFYWVHKIEGSGKMLVAAADCTGHGVPGALVSIVCLNALNRCVDEFGLIMPGEILDKATEIIQDSFRQSENDVKDGMDIALCLIDREAKELIFAGAHNPLWIFSANHLTEIKGDNQPVGKQHIPKPFANHKISYQSNDLILLSTDGFADQFGGDKGKKLKTKKFKQLIENYSNGNITDIKNQLDSFFISWKGHHDQVDDVLVVGIKLG